MIPLSQMPGHSNWEESLPALIALDTPLWVHGDAGCGVSSLIAWLGARRGVAVLDDAELADPGARDAWIRDNPRGVLGSHRSPEDPLVEQSASRCISLRLSSLEDDPESVSPCLAVLAEEEGVSAPIPSALTILPCPGNLRGLRNRLVRWKLLGQLPDDVRMGVGGSLPLDSEDLASNLHVLERLLLHRALRRSYGNRVEAARRMGISRRHLYLLIARHGDPVRGEIPTNDGPKRLGKQGLRQNSSNGPGHR